MHLTIGGKDMRITQPTRAGLMEEVRRRLRDGRGFRLATVNLDHLVKIAADPAFARAYGAHELVVADGRPVVWLSRLAGRPVELCSGSDLVLPLCRLAAAEGCAIAMIGSTDETLQAAEAHLTAAVPGLRIAFRHAPPMGFDPEGPEAARLLDALAGSGARLCFLALGAPKQEVLAARARDPAPAVGFASIGAGLDFLGGRQRRAPRWMRALALEWLWRAMGAPRRMVPRYARCFAILPGLAVQALRQRMG